MAEIKEGSTTAPAEIGTFTAALYFLWQGFPAIQGSATLPIREAINNVPTSDLGLIGGIVMLMSTAVGMGVQLEAFRRRGLSGDPFANVVFSQTKSRYLSCALGLAAGYIAVNAADSLGPIGYMQGDEGRLFWASMMSKAITSTAISVFLNMAIANGKFDPVIGAIGDIQSRLAHQYSASDISYLPDMEQFRGDNTSMRPQRSFCD